MKKEADEIIRLKLQLAQTEALLEQEKLKREAFETMIDVAEKDGAARAVPNANGTESASPLSGYANTLRAVAAAIRLGKSARLGMIPKNKQKKKNFTT